MDIILKQLEDSDPFRAGDHTLLRELLHPANDPVDLPFSLAHAFLLPGESSRPHRLGSRHEIYIITRGRGSLHLDDRRFPVSAGTIVLIPSGTVQWLVNEGDTKLELFCIVQPPWEKADEAVWADNTQGL